jgi:hypothetical protein
MFSWVSFTAIWRYRKQFGGKSAALKKTGSVRASEASDEYFPETGLPEDYDPVTTHDLSYEDAMLDARVRHFMSEEYGRIEPSQGMFQRLMKLISAEQVQSRVRSKTRFAGFFSRVYRVVSGQTLSRLVPSGIAVAILIVVGLGSSTSGMLQNSSILVGAKSTPVIEQAVVSHRTTAPVQRETTNVQTITQSSADVTGGEEAYIVVSGWSTMNVPLLTRHNVEMEAPSNRMTLDPF